ncbi:MAG: aa3-type cytochrome c oxidase subunit IV [Enhydrobacter sp.]|nr:aa3-type cytochrome c oxidase subunit IV [Enhydrobacter sp.]
MVQHSIQSQTGVSAVEAATEELVAHERTYEGFTVFATGVTVHIAILLSSLALAFFANATTMAFIWFFAAHVGLIVLLVRLAHMPRASVDHLTPRVVPLRR